MSVRVTVEFEGTALAEIPSRDQAEHLARVLRDELAKIGGSLDEGKEIAEDRKERAFLGSQAFWGYGPGRRVVFEGGYHLNPPADPAPDPA